MHIPFISSSRRLFKRKGGGGGGKGGGSSGKGSSIGKSSSSSGKSSGTSSMSKTSSISKGKTSTYDSGSSSPRIIPTGPFAGRTEGGGSRAQIFGTRSVQTLVPKQISDSFVKSIRKRLPRFSRTWCLW